MSNSLLPLNSFPTSPAADENRTSTQLDKVLHKHTALLTDVWQLLANTWVRLGRYNMVAINVGIVLAYFTLLRTVILVSYAELSTLTIGQIASMYWVGLRFDLLVALCFAIPQIIHITVVPERLMSTRASRILLELEWLIAFLFIPFLCIAEYIFFDEFQSRLNYIAFEYIVYPTEVCCNIWQSYPIIELVSIVGICGGTFWFLLRNQFHTKIAAPMPWTRRYGFLATAFVGVALLWTTTSADSRQVCRDRVANECSWNGLYSFVTYAWTCRFDYNQNYATLSDSEVIQKLRNQVVKPGDTLNIESNNPVDRIVTTGQPKRDLNVVLILEESFGSDFVGVLGDDRKLTPNFDALSHEGILFDNFYATGNRTARALEAVLTSMPPIPTESILKRDHSDRVFTLANVLAERGYERLFVTGGRGLFDGVRTFMTANGFNRFAEQADISDAVFTNAWGVSDEDLFRKSLGELDHLHETGRPFFATLLTVSNHRPYTYPEGRIPEDGQSRENAVKYADWALGYFFREAKAHDFYRNTIFVVMGDHGARVTGSQLFPTKSYRVPVLMIHPDGDQQAARCSTLACSLDIAPTIMGQLGGEYRSVFYGQDALKVNPDQGRAIMQHNHDVALLDPQDQMLVLGFGKTAWGFQLDQKDHQLKKVEPFDTRMMENAVALFQSAYELYYSNRWFPDSDDENYQ